MEFGELDQIGLGKQLAEKAGMAMVHTRPAQGGDQLFCRVVHGRYIITSLDVCAQTIYDKGVVAFGFSLFRQIEDTDAIQFPERFRSRRQDRRK